MKFDTGYVLFRGLHIGPDETRVLNEIRELWQALRLNLQQQRRRWTGLLERNLRARAIQGSNSIEGYVVSDEDALAAVDGEAPEGADETSWINVLHYREAMDYVLQLAPATDFAYSKDLIRSLHFLMVRHEPKANPGRWRPGAIYVRSPDRVVYEGPPAEDVSRLMDELITELNRRDGDAPTRMVRAAMAHLNLVMIHPFSDGNGRMARCLQTLVLARGGVLDPTFSSIEEYLGRNTLAYYNVLAEVGRGKWSPHDDTLPWVRFCLTAHYRQAKSGQRRLNAIAEIGQEIEAELERRGLPERAAPPLVNAALGEKVRNPAYRHHADVSAVVASRDLKQLVDAGLLIPSGEKRGRSYVASDWLSQLAAQRRNQGPIEDPFGVAASAASSGTD